MEARSDQATYDGFLPMPSALEYYAQPGIMTEPGEHASMLDGLPEDLSRLCHILQGVLPHLFWAERQGVFLPESRKAEVRLRSMADKLARLREIDDRPLTHMRPRHRRLVANCRDCAVLLCGILRHLALPARARCGFAKYFLPDRYEDHWLCEY